MVAVLSQQCPFLLITYCLNVAIREEKGAVHLGNEYVYAQRRTTIILYIVKNVKLFAYNY